MATDTPVTDTRANASKSSLHILRLPRVCEITGLGRSMIYQLEADGLFPQRVKLTRRTVVGSKVKFTIGLHSESLPAGEPATAHSSAPPEKHARTKGTVSEDDHQQRCGMRSIKLRLYRLRHSEAAAVYPGNLTTPASSCIARADTAHSCRPLELRRAPRAPIAAR